MATQYLRNLIILGQGGFNKTNNINAIPATDMLIVRNCDIHGGALTKMHGAIKYNDTAIDSGAGIQGLAFFPSHKNISYATDTNAVAESGDDVYEYQTDGGDKTNVIDADFISVGYNGFTVSNITQSEFSTFSDDNAVGTQTWSNPDNAQSDDAAFASANAAAFQYKFTHYLKALDISSATTSIPVDAQIVGVEVKIKVVASTTPVAPQADWIVSLVKGGTVSGDNKASQMDLGSGTITTTYGSSSDLWGLSLTAADVQASDFGVVYQARIGSPAVSTKPAYVEYIQINVYYKQPRRNIGLRFPTIGVPTTGASIVDARIRMTAYSSHSNTVSNGGNTYICKTDHTSGSSNEPGVGASWETYWRILDSTTETVNVAVTAWATATDYTGTEESAINVTVFGINETDADMAIFTSGTSNPATGTSYPATTANKNWGMRSHLGAGLEYESPNLFNVVQEMIDNANWTLNNSMGFTIQYITGGGEPDVYKDFYSFDEGTAGYRAELYVQWSTESATSETVIAATDTGKLIDVASTGASTTLGSTGTAWTNYSGDANSAPVFVEGLTSGGKRMFCFNGEDIVQMWDGSSANTDDVTNPPGDWSTTHQPTGGIIHQGRMFCWGVDTQPHTVYYSVPGAHDDYTSVGSGTFTVYPGKGEKIVNMFSYLGRLFVLKYPYGIYWVDTSRGMSYALVNQLSDSVGGAGPRCMAAVDKDALFVGSDGFIHYIRGVDTLGDAESSKVLPEKLREWVEDRVSLSTLNRASVAYSSIQGVAYFLLGVTDAAKSQIALGVDSQANKPRLLEFDRDNAESITEHNNAIYYGGTDGFIYLTEHGTYDLAGAAYEAEWSTHELELTPHGIRQANLHDIIIYFHGTGTQNCDFEIYRDGVLSQSFSAQVTGNEDIKKHRERLFGDCSHLRIVGKNGTAGEFFQISKIIVGFKPGNERL